MAEDFFSREWYIDIWEDFFRRFKKKIQKFDGKWVFEQPKTELGDYHHAITLFPTLDRCTLIIDYDDLSNAAIHQRDSKAGINGEYDYGIYEQLAKQVERHAHEARHCARLAIIRLTDKDFLLDHEELIKAEFSSIQLHKEIPEINHELMNRFVHVEGVVIFMDDVPKLIQLNRVYECSLGHLTMTSVNKQNPPRKCGGFDRISKEHVQCEEEFLEENSDLAKTDDIFDLLIQQRTDHVPDLKSPATMWVKVQGRDNVRFVLDTIRLGDFVAIDGIIKAEESQERSNDKKVKIFDYFLKSSSLQKRPISELVQDDPNLKELVKVAVQSDTEEEDYMKLVRSVSPDIYKVEGDVIAEATLLTCVGTEERTNPISGSRTRGEIQIFLCGDPSSAKTTYGKWACKVVPRAFYNSGDKTSAVSLIGGVKPSHKEGKTGKLEVGSYGLGQLVVIDELEKMKPEDLQRLSEPLQDDQSITLAKQGYYKHQAISIATIALANPVKDYAKWDITLDIFQNTKLPSWLLQRFDAIFIMRDIQSDYDDMAKINFKASSMKNQMRSREFARVKDKQQFALQASKTSVGDLYSIGFMKHWIQYVRDNFKPNVWESEECLHEIDKFYMKFRKYSIRTPKNQEERESWTRDKEIPAIELRGYMALCRFTEAHARACHRNYCTIADAEAAINIVQVSKLSAGLNMKSLLSGDKLDQDPELRELRLKAMQDVKNEMLDRQRTQEGRTFTDQLEKISWVPCTNTYCRGQGVIYDGDLPETCPECLGQGGFRKAFTQNDFYTRCSNARVPLGIKMFKEMFKRSLMSGEIVLDKAGPIKLFQNTKSKVEYTMDKAKLDSTKDKFNFLRNETEKETAEGVSKRRLLERHSDLVKRLEGLDEDKDSEAQVGSVLILEKPKPKMWTLGDEEQLEKDARLEALEDEEIEKLAEEKYRKYKIKKIAEEKEMMDSMKTRMEAIEKYMKNVEKNPPELLPITEIPRDPVYRDWKESERRKLEETYRIFNYNIEEEDDARTNPAE